jgi:hypothetical protein
MMSEHDVRRHAESIVTRQQVKIRRKEKEDKVGEQE